MTGYPADHHPCRRAARPDADRAARSSTSIARRRQDHRSCSRNLRCTAATRRSDQRTALTSARPAAEPAQHPRRRPLPVLRPRRRPACRSRPPTASSMATALRAGLKQIIAERRQADLGASGLGRLVVGGRPHLGSARRGRRSRRSASSSPARRHCSRRRDRDAARPARRHRSSSISAQQSQRRRNRPVHASRCPMAPARTSRSPPPTRRRRRRRVHDRRDRRPPPRPTCRPPSPRRSARSRTPRCPRLRRSRPATTSSISTPPTRRSGSLARRSTPRPR